jgi:hypothetical protein
VAENKRLDGWNGWEDCITSSVFLGSLIELFAWEIYLLINE